MKNPNRTHLKNQIGQKVVSGLLLLLLTATSLYGQPLILGPQPNQEILATEGTEMQFGSTQVFLVTFDPAGSITWDVVGLPPGLSVMVDDATGYSFVGGTLADDSAGTYPVTVTATNTDLLSTTVNVSYTIFEEVETVTDALADATRQIAYEPVVLEAEFGLPPYKWEDVSEEGDFLGLPDGLFIKSVTLSANSPGNDSNVALKTGQIQGTPKYQVAPGTYKVKLKVTDDSLSEAIQEVELIVLPGVTVKPFEVNSETQLNAINAISIDPISINAQGGTPPYELKVKSDLPPGLSIDEVGQGSWMLQGTPKLESTDPLDYQVEIKINDQTIDSFSETRNINIDIELALSLAGATFPPAQEGSPYDPVSMKVLGDYDALSFDNTTGLPTGLSFVANNDGTIELQGMPTALTASNDDYTVNLVVESLNAWDVPVSAEYSFELTVLPLPLSILTSSLPQAALNQSYKLELTSIGGIPPISWQAADLPQGLELVLDEQTRTYSLEGTVTDLSPGGNVVSLLVSDSSLPALAATTKLQLNVITQGTPPLSVQTSFLTPAQVGTTYDALELVAEGGTPPYTWQADGGLPPGLSIETDGNGAFFLFGTPQEDTQGIYQPELIVSDSDGNVSSAIFALIVLEPDTSSSDANPSAEEVSSANLTSNALTQAAAGCNLSTTSSQRSIFFLAMLLLIAAWARPRKESVERS